MSKGARRERQARELYEQAGFNVYLPENSKFGDNDLWNLFDLAAFSTTQQPAYRFVQVKSNQARGIESWAGKARPFAGPQSVAVDFVVCHDREGWRLLQPTADSYETVVDGREQNGDMGMPIVEYLD